MERREDVHVPLNDVEKFIEGIIHYSHKTAGFQKIEIERKNETLLICSLWVENPATLIADRGKSSKRIAAVVADYFGYTGNTKVVVNIEYKGKCKEHHNREKSSIQSESIPVLVSESYRQRG